MSWKFSRAPSNQPKLPPSVRWSPFRVNILHQRGTRTRMISPSSRQIEASLRLPPHLPQTSFTLHSSIGWKSLSHCVGTCQRVSIDLKSDFQRTQANSSPESLSNRDLLSPPTKTPHPDPFTAIFPSSLSLAPHSTRDDSVSVRRARPPQLHPLRCQPFKYSSHFRLLRPLRRYLTQGLLPYGTRQFWFRSAFCFFHLR